MLEGRDVIKMTCLKEGNEQGVGGLPKIGVKTKENFMVLLLELLDIKLQFCEEELTRVTLDFILFVGKGLLSDYGTRVRLYRIVARAVSGNYGKNLSILESE